MPIKRIISVLIIIIMASVLCSCGKSKEPSSFVPDPDYKYKGDGTGDFPDLITFESETLDGGTFSPKDFTSKDLTVINIWATWCGPCRNELPELAEFAAKLPDNVGFVTFCDDGSEEPEKAESLLEKAGYKGKTVISGTGDIGNLMSSIMYVPTTVFVDDSGRIIEALIGSPSENLQGYYLAAVNEFLELTGHERIEIPGITEPVFDE